MEPGYNNTWWHKPFTTMQAHEYDIADNEYMVWSTLTNRWCYGSTLTIARHNRSESERVYREHHAKNEDN